MSFVNADKESVGSNETVNIGMSFVSADKESVGSNETVNIGMSSGVF